VIYVITTIIIMTATFVIIIALVFVFGAVTVLSVERLDYEPDSRGGKIVFSSSHSHPGPSDHRNSYPAAIS
jgi:hypothetical protein